MKVTVKSYVTKGGVRIPVYVTTSVEDGIGVHLTGHLNDIAVKEVLLRACTALQSAGLSFPARRILIDIRADDGLMIAGNASNLDLPVALSVILASGGHDAALKDIDRYAVAGELGLDGSVRGVRDVDIIAAKPLARRLILPSASRDDIQKIRETIPSGKFFAVSHVNDALRVFSEPDTFDICTGTVLRRFREQCFDIASSGMHGDYPDDMEEFNRAVEDGFSDDGRKWTARDGSPFSCEDETNNP